MPLAPILYVEDEMTDVILTQLAFERVGVAHPLKAVTNGQKAIEYLSGGGLYADRQQYPDPCLVLLDLNLPIQSGMEVLKWIRSQPQFTSLPVVVYTSSENQTDVRKARELGANEYYVKSMRLSETDKIVQYIRDRWLKPVPSRPPASPAKAP